MNGKKIFGILLVFIGIFLLLGEFGMIDITIGEFISKYWPSILIVIGVYKLLTDSISKTTGIILIIIGGIFQLRNSQYFNIFEYNLFWPIVIILIGVYVLFSSKDGVWKVSSKDTLGVFTLFSSSNNKNISRNFKGGSITVVFGGADVDLREACISGEQEIKIDVLIVFGEVNICVPEEWNVIVKGTHIFADCNDRVTKNKFDADKPTLIISSFVVFGEIKIMNDIL
ncbi:hypothetical protein Y919_04710 [Caloranaerobacter azorensis H53214]|uniref:LiaF transmembrane domain-containing protein n=2 Tax=Caloranaerobacter azorensis TaxID=116090 RepID=A0A096CVV5_9FIRM|nr:DUF5668 domain-containing protein [Caloranaerobacter azorensis]KGG80679.1 hypothetical protein Y919_04710 [Caloranaerobacter azorensis H53214]